MYWDEDKQGEQGYVVPDDVLDVAYSIRCRTLPVDHAHALHQALRRALPWLDDEELAGIHTIHVAESGNGWIRPENANDLLYLSRRTKLVLRIPRHRLGDAEALRGRSLDVAGHLLEVGQSSVRPLSSLTTIFSRYIVADENDDESGFMHNAMLLLKSLGIKPKKMMCGLGKTIATPDKTLHVRSLMLADMEVEDSVKLQQRGLGPWRQLGCGLFIPHKDISEVRQKQE
jgi:CRISPR-associated protein Cas6